MITNGFKLSKISIDELESLIIWNDWSLRDSSVMLTIPETSLGSVHDIVFDCPAVKSVQGVVWFTHCV